MAYPSAPSEGAFLSQLDSLITLALAEDVGAGDLTTEATVPISSRSRAHFLAKETGVLSGIQVARIVFARVDAALLVEFTKEDGASVNKGDYFGTAFGSTRSLLVAERLVLNLMQRMSGIASSTAVYVRTLASEHTKLLDTRKTVPGLRLLDKAAVRHGGGVNHRIGLFDMVLIKDNHIEAAGGIPNAVRDTRKLLAARSADAPVVQVEVEARTLDEVRDVLACGTAVDRILLDNMVSIDGAGQVNTSVLQEALKIIREAHAANPTHRLFTEASGNVSLLTVHAIGLTGVDFISVGALTHSVTALDISMKIKLEQA